jgi:hypothetical protein
MSLEVGTGTPAKGIKHDDPYSNQGENGIDKIFF